MRVLRRPALALLVAVVLAAASVAAAPASGAAVVAATAGMAVHPDSSVPSAITAPKLVFNHPSSVSDIYDQLEFSFKVTTAIPASGGFFIDFEGGGGADGADYIYDANTHALVESCDFDHVVGEHDDICDGVAFAAGRSLVMYVDGYSGPVGVHALLLTTCVACHRATEIDAEPISSSAWVVTSAVGVSTPTLAVSPNKETGAFSTWTAAFAVSSQGGLSSYNPQPPQQGSDLNPALSSVYVTIPAVLYYDDQFGDQTSLTLTDTSRPGVRFDLCSWTYNQPTDTETAQCDLVAGAVVARDHIAAVLDAVTNPAPGSYHFSIATTTDTVPVDSKPVVIGAAKGVSKATVSLSPSNAVEVAATVSATFTVSSTGAIPAFGRVDMDVVDADADETVSGGTVKDNGRTVSTNCDGETPQDVSCQLSSPVAAGDTITMSIARAYFPTSGTSKHVVVWTSSDPTHVTSNAFQVVSSRPMNVTAVTNSSDSPGSRTGMTITATVSAHGGLDPAFGNSVQVVFPASTQFGAGSLAPVGSIKDVTQGNVVVASTSSCEFVPDDGNPPEENCYITSKVNANDTLLISASGIVNPGIGTYTLSLSSTSDQAVAESPEYSITGSVTAPTVAVTPSAAAGGLSHYRLQLQTSPTGALKAANGDLFYLEFPNGTGLGGDLTDSTIADNGVVIGSCREFVAPFVVCQLTSGDVAGGDDIDIELSGIVNPPAGSYQLQISTSTDQDYVLSQPYSIAPAAPVTGTSVALGPTSNAGASSNYAVTFRSSLNGALSPTAHSSVTVQFPAGTGLASVGATLTNAGASVGACPPTSGTTLTCAVAVDVPKGTVLVVLANGVINAPSGNHTVTISTSSDPTTATAVYSTAPAASPSNVTIATVGNAHGKATNYTLTFEPSDAGTVGPGGTVTFQFPAGTDTSIVTSATITDGGEDEGGSCVPTATAAVTCTITGFLSADDLITVLLKKVVNPAAGTYTATVTTSSDALPATSNPYTIR